MEGEKSGRRVIRRRESGEEKAVCETVFGQVRISQNAGWGQNVG